MKKCPYCAEEIQEEAMKCRHCGEWLKDKKIPGSHDSGPDPGPQSADLKKPVPKTQEPYISQIDPRYQGVRGWLLLFFLSLILSPVVNVISINSNHDALSPYFERVQGLYTLYLLRTAKVMQRPFIVLSSVCGLFMVAERCITYDALYNTKNFNHCANNI